MRTVSMLIATTLGSFSLAACASSGSPALPGMTIVEAYEVCPQRGVRAADLPWGDQVLDCVARPDEYAFVSNGRIYSVLDTTRAAQYMVTRGCAQGDSTCASRVHQNMAQTTAQKRNAVEASARQSTASFFDAIGQTANALNTPPPDLDDTTSRECRYNPATRKYHQCFGSDLNGGCLSYGIQC